MMMMEFSSSEKRKSQPTKEKRTELCMQVISDEKFQHTSAWYKINFDPELVPNPLEVKIEENQEPVSEEAFHINCGSAVVDSILYLFGGSRGNQCRGTNDVYYLNTTMNSSCKGGTTFQEFSKKMLGNRVNPKTLTIDKNIYIFGSDSLGLGVEPSEKGCNPWAEVFNTSSSSFKPLKDLPPNVVVQLDRCHLTVSAVIRNDEGGNRILLATEYLVDLLFYDVVTEKWEYKKMDTCSHFPLYSMRSPVKDNILYLFGAGKVCAFDLRNYQFLKNHVCLLESALLFKDHSLLRGVIHCFGNGMFCVVLSEIGSQAQHIHVLSFRINDDRELGIEAGDIHVADYFLRGHTFVDSVELRSKQTAPLENLHKRAQKNYSLEGGCSSVGNEANVTVTSHPISKLDRIRAAMDKNIVMLEGRIKLLMDDLTKFSDNIDDIIPRPRRNPFLQVQDEAEAQDEIKARLTKISKLTERYSSIGRTLLFFSNENQIVGLVKSGSIRRPAYNH